MNILRTSGAALVACVAIAACAPAGTEQTSDTSALEARLTELEIKLQRQEDIEAIRRLQYAYNYYNTSRMAKQVLDLVSENAVSIEIGGRGVYYGKEGFVRAFGGYDENEVRDRAFPFGFSLFQLASMDVITLSEDGVSAKARVAVLTPILNGFPEKVTPRMNGGIYEMEYVKEEDQWLISKFKYVHSFNAMVNDKGEIYPGYSTAPNGREDAPTTWYHPWPETGILPFHFPNPVTGEFPPEITGDTKYWIGNWPDEFGTVGVEAEYADAPGPTPSE